MAKNIKTISGRKPDEIRSKIVEGRVNKNLKTKDDLLVNTFSEYFMSKKNSISFAIRRHWIGQKSKSENGRAKSLFKSPKNKPWCFNKAVGTPKSGWDLNIAVKDRKTAYTLSIEQK